TIHGALVSLWRMIRQEGVRFGNGWRQTRQVQRDTAQESGLAGFRRRTQTFAFQAGQDEGIDRIGPPGLVFDGWGFGPLGSNQGPMGLPGSALFNPAAKQVDLPWRELPGGVRGGHAVVIVRGGDTPQEFALARLAGDHDDRVMVAGFGL